MVDEEDWAELKLRRTQLSNVAGLLAAKGVGGGRMAALRSLAAQHSEAVDRLERKLREAGVEERVLRGEPAR